MKLWSRTVILYLLIALARSEEQLESDDAKPAGVCNVAECYKLFNSRLEAIEMAVRKIVSAFTSQTSDVFAPIKAILEEDPTIISIMSSNSTTYSSITINTNASSVNNDAFKESKLTNDNYDVLVMFFFNCVFCFRRSETRKEHRS